LPWIPFYADEIDFRSILTWLNGEQDIAFIISNGYKKWIAKKIVDRLEQGRYCLWHTPSGPLPLLQANPTKQNQMVMNPWNGWKEKRTGADSTIPFFGDPPGVIWLNARPVGREAEKSIGLSSFEWIGNWYKVIRRPANPDTEKFWQRLRRQVKKVGVRIPRTGPIGGPSPEIFAFPSAYQEFTDGHPRDGNPYP
jgi:hypothetical protein